MWWQDDGIAAAVGSTLHTSGGVGVQLAPNRLLIYNKALLVQTSMGLKISFLAHAPTKHDTHCSTVEMCFELHKIAGCLPRDIPYVTIVCNVHTSLGTLQSAPMQFLLRHLSHSGSLLCFTIMSNRHSSLNSYLFTVTLQLCLYMYDRWRKLTANTSYMLLFKLLRLLLIDIYVLSDTQA